MKMHAVAAAGAALLLAPCLAAAQEAAAPAAEAAEAAGAAEPAAVEATAEVAAEPEKAMRQGQIEAGTPVTLSLNHELHSRSAREGDSFPLSLVQDLTLDGQVVIPRGTRAVGEIVWRTGRGVFGKSAKMEIALRYIEYGGRRIPLEGNYHQEGEGNTAATIGAVLGAGVVGGLIVTGRSAVIPAGRELQARIIDAIPVELPAAGPGEIAQSYQPSPVLTTGRTQIVRRRSEPRAR